jgi:hypothetical protein
MRIAVFFAVSAVAVCNLFSLSSAEEPAKPRVFVSTDIGGSDPDDFQSMVHYLVYADRFDTEGLVSSPPDKGRAEHILEALAAYEKDYDNLHSWSADYPAPDALRAVVRQGAIDPQPGDVPESLSEGAKLLVDRALADDPRPLYVLVWGSITDVAQAVHANPATKEKIRVHFIGSWNTAQDRKSRNYLLNYHPDLWLIESDSTFRGMYMGGNQEGEWGNVKFPELHVAGHGALGALFMTQKTDIKMGDTPSVLYMVHGDPAMPEAEHWGGAYVRPEPEKRPTYWHDNPDPALQHKDKPGAVTVNKWRVDYLEDWKQRMDRAQSKKPKE